MSFAGEMQDFLKAAGSMSDTRYRNAARRKIEWEMKEPDNTGPSSFDSPVGGGIGTTDAPSDGKSASGGRTFREGKIGNRGGGPFVQQVYDYYRSRGLSHAAAAGIAGNLMQESGGDGRVLSGARAGDAGASKHAAQWQGKRLANLYKFAGTNQPSLQQQLDFVLEEMNPNSPYRDDIAAQNSEAVFGAENVEGATAAFRKFFERPSANDLGSRTKFALTAVDSGNYGGDVSGGAATTDGQQTKAGGAGEDAGAIPEEGDQQAADGGGAEITVVAAPEAGQQEAPQVSADLDPLNVQEDTLMAASGGAIPDDTVHYEIGGTTYMDKYNANRAYTQPIAQTPPAATANRISIPQKDTAWRNWGPGGSPTQQAVAKARKAAAAPPPAAPAPAASTMPKYSFGQVGQNLKGRIGPLYINRAQSIADSYNKAHPNGDDPVAYMRAQDAINAALNQGLSGRGGSGGHDGGGYTTSGRGWEEGGIVYARGGPVRTSETPIGRVGRREFDQMVERAGGGQHGRDIVAMRLARQEGRPGSSAYRPRDDTPAQPGGGGGAGGGGGGKTAAGGGENVPVPTPRPSPIQVRHPPNPKVGTPDRSASGSNGLLGRGGMKPGSAPSGMKEYPTNALQTQPGKTHKERRGMVVIDVPDAPGAIPDEEDTTPHSERFERGGSVPDDKLHRVEGKPWWYQTRARQKPAETKSSKSVRKSDTSKVKRNAKKRPKSASGDGKVPTPTPRPNPVGIGQTVRPGAPEPQGHYAGFEIGVPDEGGIPKPRPTPGDVNINIVRPEGPPGGMPAAPPAHFDQMTELFPQLKGINIPVAESGSGEPPGSMGVQYPGVSPPVTGYDVPQGGQWAAFAKGGVIPDEEGPYPNWRAEEAGYTTSSADANVRSATRARPRGIAMGDPREDRTTSWDGPAELEAEAPPPAAPRFRDVSTAARGAVDTGLKGLQKILGLQSDGAMPSPDDDMRHTQGAQRLASGEGAATSEEVAAVDKATGVDQLGIQDEGMKNLVRIDRAVNWYLQRGQGDKAEAAAASLLQFGAVKVRQAGTMAAAALSEYQESGDPQDLQHAIGYIKLAHQLIPDGFDIDIDVDPKTRQMVVTAIDSEGQAQKHVVDPRALPGLLQKAMDGSAYWGSVMRIGHPTIANTRESRAAAAEQAAATREANNLEWNRRNEIQQEQKVGAEDRAAARKLWETNYELDVGKTESERAKVADNAFYSDWSERFNAAQGADKQALISEGLGYRYEHTKDRQDAIADDELVGDADMQDRYGDDIGTITDMARVIARKNDALDAAGAMSIADALITGPVDVNPDGTLNVNGWSLVFNPQLLPGLGALRKKYRPTE